MLDLRILLRFQELVLLDLLLPVSLRLLSLLLHGGTLRSLSQINMLKTIQHAMQWKISYLFAWLRNVYTLRIQCALFASLSAYDREFVLSLHGSNQKICVVEYQ